MESARLLSSSGESDFFPTTISGWAFRKSLLKSDILTNAKPVCNDAEFKGITEMSIDIHLLDGRISGGVGRHGAVGSFIRVEGIIQPVGFLKVFSCRMIRFAYLGLFS